MPILQTSPNTPDIKELSEELSFIRETAGSVLETKLLKEILHPTALSNLNTVRNMLEAEGMQLEADDLLFLAVREKVGSLSENSKFENEFIIDLPDRLCNTPQWNTSKAQYNIRGIRLLALASEKLEDAADALSNLINIARSLAGEDELCLLERTPQEIVIGIKLLEYVIRIPFSDTQLQATTLDSVTVQTLVIQAKQALNNIKTYNIVPLDGSRDREEVIFHQRKHRGGWYCEILIPTLLPKPDGLIEQPDRALENIPEQFRSPLIQKILNNHYENTQFYMCGGKIRILIPPTASDP